MSFIRLLPILLANLLFSAHLFRNFGMLPAVITALTLSLLFLRAGWALRLHQSLMAVSIVFWIRAAVVLTLFRMDMGQPYLRLLLILSAVTLFTAWALFHSNGEKIKGYFGIKK
jgi:hypothetical protein